MIHTDTDILVRMGIKINILQLYRGIFSGASPCGVLPMSISVPTFARERRSPGITISEGFSSSGRITSLQPSDSLRRQ